MIKLDERLKAVLDAVKPCDTLADIGADHGKIAVSVKLRGLADKVIASDVSAASVKKAGDLAKACGVYIETRVGDGTETLTGDEFDTAVIAGMGGLEIVSILRKAEKLFKRYILMPHSKAPELRRFLSEKSIKPYIDKKVLSKGKYYDLIVCSPGVYRPDIDEILFGFHENTTIFRGFCECELLRLRKIAESGGGKNARELSILEGIIERQSKTEMT